MHSLNATPWQPPHRTAGTKDANCQAVQDLCASETSCSVALQTKKHKKAKGGPAVGCCSAAYGGCRCCAGFAVFVVQGGYRRPAESPFYLASPQLLPSVQQHPLQLPLLTKRRTAPTPPCLAVVPPPPFCVDQSNGTACTADDGKAGTCQAGECGE